jgi:hypothetical protein
MYGLVINEFNLYFSVVPNMLLYQSVTMSASTHRVFLLVL